MEEAPAEITGSFSMLFLMVLGRFPEEFSFSISPPPFSMITGLILFAHYAISGQKTFLMALTYTRYVRYTVHVYILVFSK